MSFGKYTYGRPRIYSWSKNTKLIIGNFCSIAENVKIYLDGNHRTDWVTTYPFGHINTHVFNNFNGYGHPSSKGDVIIGNDVWIGDNVTIMKWWNWDDEKINKFSPLLCNNNIDEFIMAVS